ncbi:MAG: DUF554 domain-containing protein [Clostridia bacterium]|nr:DUF554 domain-containing protein [Clostridia bacterium]
MSALWGTLVNVAAIVVGSLAGLLLKKGLPTRVSGALGVAVGLCVLYIGIDGCLAGDNMLVAVLSMVIGAVVGELLDLDGKLNRLGETVQNRFSKGKNGESTIAQSFVSASLLFCVGAMAIVGSLQSGISGDHNTLYVKSILDGISSVVFATTLGGGVILSIIPLFLYQGAIALLAQFIAPYLSEAVIAEMTCVGSLLIVALALNLLNITKIKVANLLPAVVLPIVLCPLYQLVL